MFFDKTVIMSAYDIQLIFSLFSSPSTKKEVFQAQFRIPDTISPKHWLLRTNSDAVIKRELPFRNQSWRVLGFYLGLKKDHGYFCFHGSRLGIPYLKRSASQA